MKTRPYHHGDLRAALLTRAEQTLREKGPAELSLRELARETGVSPAAPSRHFRSKQALLDALALEGFDRLTTAMVEAHDRAGESFADQFAGLTRTYVSFATANAALLELMYARKHEAGAPDDLIASMHRLADLAMSLITAGQQRGEIREGPVERLAVPLFAMLQGLTALILSGALQPDQVEESLDETIALLLRGYAP
ncbi:TetR/AcrR family transcriptional regulator [Actinoplanes sp. NPDC051861]|uniref:TetR/AcrR family transcriptional regulator n=1 Tax=Actinoplanes sp. NPDC051861 TaxID=3155170 RepID=UPI00341BF3CF